MNNYQRLLLVAMLIVGAGTLCRSQNSGFGLGVVVGEPTGISFKNWTSSRNAVAGGIAWSVSKDASFHLHADYLWHSYDAIQSKEPFVLYYGVGGRFKAISGNGRLGGRGVFGIGYLFRDAPFDLFLEAVPILDIIPEIGLGLNAGLGARYFFK